MGRSNHRRAQICGRKRKSARRDFAARRAKSNTDHRRGRGSSGRFLRRRSEGAGNELSPFCAFESPTGVGKGELELSERERVRREEQRTVALAGRVGGAP